jgi:hypothetical protein
MYQPFECPDACGTRHVIAGIPSALPISVASAIICQRDLRFNEWVTERTVSVPRHHCTRGHWLVFQNPLVIPIKRGYDSRGAAFFGEPIKRGSECDMRYEIKMLGFVGRSLHRRGSKARSGLTILQVPEANTDFLIAKNQIQR